MKPTLQNCLNCKYYRLIESDSGVCRVDKSKKADYPRKKNSDSCEKWHDCGQNFFIRVGWIKAKTLENKDI
jgi:hypothetical protein